MIMIKASKLSRINWAPIRGCSCICEWRCITSWIFDRYPVAPWPTATPRLSSHSTNKAGHQCRVITLALATLEKMAEFWVFSLAARRKWCGVALQHIMYFLQLGRLMMVLRWCMQNCYVAMKYLDVCCSSSFKSLKLPSKTRLTRHHLKIS